MAPDVEWPSEKSEPEPLSTRFARWRHNQLLLALLSVAAFLVAVSTIAGLVLYFQYRPYRNKPEIPQKTCEKMYCAFGALCLVDHSTQQAYCRCEETCPDVFAPVCGNDGVTYASLCLLQKSACSQQRLIFVHHQGPCDVRDPCLDKECHFGSKCRPSLDGRTAECSCVEKCATYGDSRGSRPVCGSDGRDYPNVCELERTACKEMREITIKYQGHCGNFEAKEVGVPCGNQSSSCCEE